MLTTLAVDYLCDSANSVGLGCGLHVAGILIHLLLVVTLLISAGQLQPKIGVVNLMFIRSQRKAKTLICAVFRCQSEIPFPPDLINLKRPYDDFPSVLGKNAL
jgi:hypothetical protein